MKRILAALCIGAILAIFTAHARAGLQLSFDQATYSAPVSGTVPVMVFLTQTAGGPQVAPGNELLTAGFVVSFDNPTGVASVLSTGNMTAGPAWTLFSAATTATNATLDETSLLGISNLSSPLLLGTFNFTAQSLGQTTIRVAAQGPGFSFVTAGGNIVDPANVPTATILVVPEPPAILLGFLGVCILFVVRLCLSRRRQVLSLSAQN